MRKKEKDSRISSRTRIIVILLLGFPVLVFTYLWALSVVSEEPDPMVDFAREAMSWVKKTYANIRNIPIPGMTSDSNEELEMDKPARSEGFFAPGSAGNLAVMSQEYKGREVDLSLEERQKTMRTIFRDGQMLTEE